MGENISDTIYLLSDVSGCGCRVVIKDWSNKYIFLSSVVVVEMD
jgi:hypothetical protein